MLAGARHGCYPHLIVKIVLNGVDKDAPSDATVETLLESLGIDPRRVAVERNLTIVRRSDYAGTRLADGDRIELVHFVGGG